MNVLAVLQARMSSTRLPGKVLRPVLGRPMLLREIERIRRARTLDDLVVATSNTDADDPLAAACRDAGIRVYRGSLDDVLDRFMGAVTGCNPAHVVRLTGDCPLLDPAVIDLVVRHHLSSGADYSSNVRPPTFPDGLDVEVMKLRVLETVHREASSRAEREHVTLFIARHPDRFKMENVVNPAGDLSHLRWTVDEPADFELIEAIYAALYPSDPAFTTGDVVSWLERHPHWQAHNQRYQRNEGLTRSIAKETTSR